MNEVFGYSSLIDPRIFVGSCVKKSNLNGTHDGIIINCPIDKVDNNYIYQMVIANNIDDTLVIDLRVPIIKKKIPFVYKKYRPLNHRFSCINVYVELVEVSNVFSKDETQKILSFCDKLGLEYGEMDIIRDYKTQQIYIVDANNTPAGPPRTGLKKEDYNKALEMLKKEIEFHLLNSAV
jgi:hypothetical protein